MDSVKVKVAALMTSPRHEITWARSVIEAALKQAEIPLVSSQGVFYGQCMQRMLTDAITAGVDVAITIDFDSIFTCKDVKQLMQTAMSNEHIGAVAAVQSRRGSGYPLFNIGEASSVTLTGEPLRVQTAHFGLTAIKLDRLAKIPKPWFWCTPDENGEWTDAKIDDDIYFWRKWYDFGQSVYIDPLVSIGHLEEVVSRFDENGKHVMTYPNDWFNENLKP